MFASGKMSHGHQHTYPCRCIATDPDMALSSSLGSDFIMAPGGGVGHSHTTVYSSPPTISTSISLHNACDGLYLLGLGSGPI